MTNSQKKAIERIEKLTQEILWDERWEVKHWEIKDYEYFVSLTVETGMKDDEGTMAAIFARDRAHLFIGKRGGITYPVSKNGRHYTKVFGGYSLLQAVCDQR